MHIYTHTHIEEVYMIKMSRTYWITKMSRTQWITSHPAQVVKWVVHVYHELNESSKCHELNELQVIPSISSRRMSCPYVSRTQWVIKISRTQWITSHSIQLKSSNELSICVTNSMSHQNITNSRNHKLSNSIQFKGRQISWPCVTRTNRVIEMSRTQWIISHPTQSNSKVVKWVDHVWHELIESSKCHELNEL